MDLSPFVLLLENFQKKIGDDFEFVLHDLHGERDINVK
jgi:hypothetical protein